MSDEIDDFLKEMDKPEELDSVQETKEDNKENKSFKSNKVNLYEDKIVPLSLEPKKFVSYMRCYNVGISEANMKIPEEIILKMEKLAGILFDKGFILRHNGNNQDDLLKAAMRKGGDRSEIYLPWKSFNKELSADAKLKSPNEKAYRTTAGLVNGNNEKDIFNDILPSSVRAILSSSTHCMLGENVDVPSKLVVIYSEDKADNPADADYKKTKNATGLINIGTQIGATVINLANDNANDKIKEFLTTIKD